MTLLTALALLATLTAAAPAGAGGGGHPSARALWQQYPLGPTRGHAAGGTVTPTPATPASSSPTSSLPTFAPPSRATQTSGGVAVWAVLLLVTAIAIIGLWMLIRERRPGSARADPETRTAATGPRGPQGKGAAATPAGRAGTSASDEQPGASAVPPAPEQAWTAQVEWRGTGRHCTFCVVATTADAGRTATLPASPLIEWPPADPSAVRAMTEAVHTLEVSLLAAGWSPLPPGDAWFAKRFAWQPRAEEGVTPHAGSRPRRVARAKARSARFSNGGADAP